MKMDDIKTTFPDQQGNKRAAVWTDKKGVTHKAVGSYAEPRRECILLLWTACEKKDIPANAATLIEPGDKVDCPECANA